jgi:hypothetical protein
MVVINTGSEKPFFKNRDTHKLILRIIPDNRMFNSLINGQPGLIINSVIPLKFLKIKRSKIKKFAIFLIQEKIKVSRCTSGDLRGSVREI